MKDEEIGPGEPTTEFVAEAVGITNWEFIERVPTRDDVVALLETLPDAYGEKYVDYADFVQALPQRKKIQVPHPEKSNLKVDQYIDCYTLYMSVAGRIKMLNAIAAEKEWRVDFEPEPVTPTGIPGYLRIDGLLVYREYCSISWREEWRADDMVAPSTPLGRKPGTAWVPDSGGSGAAASNPYEKVETSARGRAIAAWGIGVLPGSGVASVEEIQAIAGNQRGLEREQRSEPNRGRKDRETLLQESFTIAEAVRQERGMSEEAIRDMVGRFLSESLGIRSVWDEESHLVDMAKVKDGQIQLLINRLEEALVDAQNRKAEL